MTYREYFQSYKDYFWQWEDNMEVIAIPNENTIAYRELVLDIFEKLTPQGIPPFGSLLLAIIATNPKGSASLDVVTAILNNSLREYNVPLAEAISFLKLLSEVPEQYKEGKKRTLLFQAIFEQCHNIISAKNSALIRDSYNTHKHKHSRLSRKKELNIQVFNKDFRTFALLKNKFFTVNDILNKVASLPEIKENLILEESDLKESEPLDLIDRLIDNNKTFHTGSLVKRIWSGLNIPVHSTLPSEQPLGGISDLTNKGDLDKLLISEYANEDIVFLSRLANNEALYIHREIPPENNNLQRVILIDISLKNWGTPKTVAFATMLAIAKHPKTNIECKAFAIGDSYYPISIASVDTIIDGLQLLEGSLHPGKGLSAFFKDHPVNKNREVFVITEPSTLKHAAMLKVMNEYKAFMNYWIYTDSEGNIDIFKRQQNSKRHIQHIKLPLEKLWQKQFKRNRRTKNRDESFSEYPLLLRNSSNIKKLLSTSDGEVFQVTHDKTLLRFFDKTSKPYEKGWELICEHLPFSAGEFEMGLLSDGERILLMFNPQNKLITLLNIDTNEKKITSFIRWKSTGSNSFVFHEQKFYHFNQKDSFSISLDGQIEKNESIHKTIFDSREKKLKDIQSKYSYIQNIFKNINEIFINEANNLVFNIHELHLNSGNHIKLDTASLKTKKIVATKNSDTEFEFADGSVIEINRSGILILKSSDSAIPFIYIPSVLDISLGVTAQNDFAGNTYFYKEDQFEITLVSPGKNILSTVKLIKEFTEMGLHDAKHAADSCPSCLLRYVSKIKADHIKKVMEAEGATIHIKPARKGSTHSHEINKIGTEEFFRIYIEPFINTIQAYGIKNNAISKK